MNYYQIEAFLAIVQTRSISGAANRLFVSQSTLSHRLSSLESELNTTLVIRNKGHRSSELTPAGEKFITIAHKWQLLWEETCRIDQAESNILHIGGTDSICNYFLPPFFKDIKQTHPSFRYSLNIMVSPQVHEMLESREIDVGIVSVPSWNKNIILQQILEESYTLICYDPESKWPSKIHPSDLDPSAELFQPWGPDYKQWHDYWWPPPERYAISMTSAQLMQEFLQAHSFWTIVPECIAWYYEQLPGYRNIHLLSRPHKRISYLAVHRYPRQSQLSGIKFFTDSLKMFLRRNKHASLLEPDVVSDNIFTLSSEIPPNAPSTDPKR